MNPKYLKPFAKFLLAFMFLVPVAIILSSYRDPTGFWVIGFIVAFVVFLFSNWDHFTRGIWLVASTAVFSAVGIFLVKNGQDKEIVDQLTAFISILGGSVGGNFMSHGILESEKRWAEKNANKR
jgi:predicted membrane protein